MSHCPTVPAVPPLGQWDTLGQCFPAIRHLSYWGASRLWDRDSFSHFLTFLIFLIFLSFIIEP